MKSFLVLAKKPNDVIEQAMAAANVTSLQGVAASQVNSNSNPRHGANYTSQGRGGRSRCGACRRVGDQARHAEERVDDHRRQLIRTAGASAPEVIVEEIMDAFAAHYHLKVETVSAAMENEFFPLPRPLRNDAAE